MTGNPIIPIVTFVLVREERGDIWANVGLLSISILAYWRVSQKNISLLLWIIPKWIMGIPWNRYKPNQDRIKIEHNY